MLGSCFALLTACCPGLLSGSLLLAAFFFLIIRCSLLFTLYSLLAAYGLALLRVLLIAAAALCLLPAAYFSLVATGYSLNDGGSSSCSLADRRAQLLNCCCKLYSIIALLASRLSSPLICIFRSSLQAPHSTLLTFF